MTYNRLIQGLRLAGVEVDRKILADLAVNDARGLHGLVGGERAAGRCRSLRRAHRPLCHGPRRPGAARSPRGTPRVVAARRLQRRRDRDETGRFLAEGPQAVREALAAGAWSSCSHRRGAHRAANCTPSRGRRRSAGRPSDGLAALAETVTPQGLVAVCRQRDVPARRRPCAGAAAGRGAGRHPRPRQRRYGAAHRRRRRGAVVVFAGAAVDPYNGKVSGPPPAACSTSTWCGRRTRGGGGRAAAGRADGAGRRRATATSDLDELADLGTLPPTAWLFGSEAHGLPDAAADAADARVRVPIYGRAESLNLAAAAAVCLYASARALHRGFQLMPRVSFIGPAGGGRAD